MKSQLLLYSPTSNITHPGDQLGDRIEDSKEYSTKCDEKSVVRSISVGLVE